jgi:hypothetical protein
MTYKSKDWEDVPDILNGLSWQLKCIAEQLETYNQSSQSSQIHAHFQKEIHALQRRVTLVEKTKVTDPSKLKNMLADWQV